MEDRTCSLLKEVNHWKLGLVCRQWGALVIFEAENATLKEVTSFRAHGFLLKITAWNMDCSFFFRQLQVNGLWTLHILNTFGLVWFSRCSSLILVSLRFVFVCV